MKSLQISKIMVILVGCYLGVVSCSPGEEGSLKVIGGQQPPENHISHRNTVGLSLNDGPSGLDSTPQCSGFVLRANWVVTAAHCMDPGTLKFVYFQNDQLGQIPVWRKIDQVIVHPDWTNAGLFDIALVHFQDVANDLKGIPEGFSGIDILREVDLSRLQSTKEMDIAGYGVSQFPTSDVASEKLHAWVVIDRFWSDFFMAPGLITYSDPEFQGACYGDSGGPAYMEYENKMLVVGITQGARGRYFNQRTKIECNEGKGVFTYLSPFRDWIYATVNAESSPSYKWGLETPDFSSLRTFCEARKSKVSWTSFFSLALLLEEKTDVPMFGCAELEVAAAKIEVLDLSPWSTYEPVQGLLSHMFHLREVTISDPNGSLAPPVNLGSFLSAEGLTKLIIDGPSLLSFRELRFLSGLTYLDISGSSEVDIRDLRQLNKIEYLSIAGPAAAELRELGNLSHLETIITKRCILDSKSLEGLFAEGTYKSLKLANFSRCAVDYDELFKNRLKLRKFPAGTVLKFQKSYSQDNADLLSQIAKNDFGVVVEFK